MLTLWRSQRPHFLWMWLFNQTWTFFFACFLSSPPSDFARILTSVKSPSSNGRLNAICKMILWATTYEIWIERNTCLHSASARYRFTHPLEWLEKSNLFSEGGWLAWTILTHSILHLSLSNNNNSISSSPFGLVASKRTSLTRLSYIH